MSELLVVEDDPDPLPTDSTYEQPTVLAAETLLAERELALYEREAVGRLSVAANRILSVYESSGDYDDCRVVSGDIMLRRRITERDEAGRTAQTISYFYVDKSDGQNYCRSWTSGSEYVNWCYQEERHEPADDVRSRLDVVFPISDLPTIERRLATRVLAKLRRR